MSPLNTPLLTRLPLPLEVGPILRLRGLGERLSSPSGSGWKPAVKRFLVHFKHYFKHFKHYFHRERIDKQILNSKIGVLIYNRTHRVLHNKVRANLRREKTKLSCQKMSCTDNWGESPLVPSGSSLPPSPLRSRPCSLYLILCSVSKKLTNCVRFNLF